MNAHSNTPVSEQWYHAAMAAADAEAAASMLEECRTAVRSQMMQKIIGEMPVNRAELQVNASPEWHEYNVKMVEARATANRLKVERDFLKMKHAERMSQEADHRLVART